MSDKIVITLNVNGEDQDVMVAASQTLLEVLRDQMHLTGAKKGCNQGVCGACTVLVEGWPKRACLSLAVACADKEIVTVEGLADGNELSPLQEAFVQGGAVQCGFCTSGMLITSQNFLDRNPSPNLEDIRQALSGNVCRCSGYLNIVDAVHSTAEG